MLRLSIYQEVKKTRPLRETLKQNMNLMNRSTHQNKKRSLWRKVTPVQIRLFYLKSNKMFYRTWRLSRSLTDRWILDWPYYFFSILTIISQSFLSKSRNIKRLNIWDLSSFSCFVIDPLFITVLIWQWTISFPNHNQNYQHPSRSKI